MSKKPQDKNFSDQEIKAKYASLLIKAKLVAFVFVLLIIPRLVLNFGSQETFLGFTKNSSFIPLVFGILIAGGFYYLFWRCPACKKLPGDSWSRTRCKQCDVELK